MGKNDQRDGEKTQQRKGTDQFMTCPEDLSLGSQPLPNQIQLARHHCPDTQNMPAGRKDARED